MFTSPLLKNPLWEIKDTGLSAHTLAQDVDMNMVSCNLNAPTWDSFQTVFHLIYLLIYLNWVHLIRLRKYFQLHFTIANSIRWPWDATESFEKKAISHWFCLADVVNDFKSLKHREKTAKSLANEKSFSQPSFLWSVSRRKKNNHHKLHSGAAPCH